MLYHAGRKTRTRGDFNAPHDRTQKKNADVVCSGMYIRKFAAVT